MFIRGFNRRIHKFQPFVGKPTKTVIYNSYGHLDRHGSFINSRVGLGKFIHLRIQKRHKDLFWSVFEYQLLKNNETFIAKFTKLNQAKAFILKTYNVGG